MRSASLSAVRNRPIVRRRPLVLLDANALFLPFRFGLALDREVDRWRPGAELGVPESVLRELDRLVTRGVPHAGTVRGFAGTLRVVIAPGSGDAAVVRAAVGRRAWVVTADRALCDRLRQRGVSVLVPRDRTRLELKRGHRPAPARNRPRGPSRGNR